MTEETMYRIYVRVENQLYKIVTADDAKAFTYDEAEELMKELIMCQTMSVFVEHEPTGERFFIGVPEAGMLNVTFVAKAITKE
jgi:hypothetical protein